MANFGDLLSELRRDKKLTQDELAHILYVTSGTISNYENNVHYPDVVKLIQLAKYFDVTTDYLLGLSTCDLSPGIMEQKMMNGRTWSQVLTDINGLPPERQRALMYVLDDMKTATLLETLKRGEEH